MATIKKAEYGDATPSLRRGQLKRIGRLSAKNPQRAKRVADKMIERDTRVERGEAFISKRLGQARMDRINKEKEAKEAAAASKPTMKKGGVLKAVNKAKNPGLSKLPTPVRNKMGYQKMGGKTPKKK